MEHCTETENADGYIGKLTKFTRRGTPLSCWGGRARRAAGPRGERSRRPKQGAGAPSSPSAALPALQGAGKVTVGSPSWGFNLVHVSSAALKSRCDALFVRGSGTSKGTQVSGCRTLFCLGLRENTSFAEVRAEEGSMPGHKSTRTDMKNQQPLYTS